MKLKYILYAVIIAMILYYFKESIFNGKKSLNGTTFYIGRDPQWHPLNLSGKELDIQIFVDSLIQQIAKNQDFKVVIQSVQNEHLLPGLQNKEFDAIAYPIVEKWGNLGQYYFSEPLFALGPVLVVRQEAKDIPFDSFEGKSIGIIRNSTLLAQVNTVPGISISPYNTVTDAFESLVNDRIDGLILDALQAYLYVEGVYQGKLFIKQPALSKAGIKLVALRTERSREFLEAFDQGLINMINDNTYHAFLKTWDFENYPMPPVDKDALQIDTVPL